MKPFDVIAVGELLIDFTPIENTKPEAFCFQANPGGGPANVAVAVRQLGGRASFVGKVGTDMFGALLKDTLSTAGVDVSGLVTTSSASTTMAFVHLGESGDRSFHFVRKPGADMQLNNEDIPKALIEGAKVLHVGSVSMTDEPARSATFYALDLAKESGGLISFDPNLRPLLWENIDAAKANIVRALPYADILKLSEEELQFLTGTQDVAKGVKHLVAQFGCSVVFITLGGQGTYYWVHGKAGHVPAYAVQAIDTTGAGDSFIGAVLYQWTQTKLSFRDWNIAELESCIRFANAVAGLTTTKRGAMAALPSLQEVEAFLSHT